MNSYLFTILNKYSPKDLSFYNFNLSNLKKSLKEWAGTCYLNIFNSGSRAKGTAISIASDVDLLISLKNDCRDNNICLREMYNMLYMELNQHYSNVRKQNVSIRIDLPSNGLLGPNLSVDITPAKQLSGHKNYHNLYSFKNDTWKQTNIQQHINDVSKSGRTNEIKLLKIWRELNNLKFPSIYLEYLVIDKILVNKPKDLNNLGLYFFHIIEELSKDIGNPLFVKIVDPANTNNFLSGLINDNEKNAIIKTAKKSIVKDCFEKVIW